MAVLPFLFCLLLDTASQFSLSDEGSGGGDAAVRAPEGRRADILWLEVCSLRSSSSSARERRLVARDMVKSWVEVVVKIARRQGTDKRDCPCAVAFLT